MSLKKTLLVGLAFAGLLLFIFFVEEPREKRIEESLLLLPGLSSESIQGIDIENKTGAIAFSRRAGKWVTAEMGYSKADTATVEGIVTALKDFETVNKIPKEDIEGDLKIYGLDKPEVKVKVKTADQSTEISFGKKNDYTGKRYAMINDGTVFFVTEELFNSAGKKIEEFKDKMPLDFDTESVSTIKIKSNKRNYEYSKGESGWRVTKPVSVTLDPSLMSTFVLDIKNLAAEGIINPTEKAKLNPKNYGLDKPYGTVEVVSKDGDATPIILNFGSRAGNKKTDYLSISGIDAIFEIPVSVPEKLFKDYTGLRERRLFLFASDLVTEVKFTIADAKTTVITKVNDSAGAKWQIDGQDGDSVFIESLINGVSDLWADGFIEPGKNYGFDKPALKIEVKLSAGARPERTLLIGSKYFEGKTFKGYHAGVDDLSEPFFISEANLKRITANKEALVPTKEKSASIQ